MRTSPLLPALAGYLRDEQSARRPAVPAAHRPGAARGHLAALPQIELLRYGVTEEEPRGICDLPAVVTSVEVEYAALRRGAGIIDGPHRGTLLVTGSERAAYLNRMLTADLRQLPAGAVRPAFKLSRKGRIEADLLVVESGPRTWIDVDVAQAALAARSLEESIFGEDVQVRDASEEHHRIALHGPEAPALLGAASGREPVALADRHATRLAVGGADVVAARRDQIGSAGIELFIPAEAARRVWDALISAAPRVAGARDAAPFVRPVGWYAFNMARIEAGTPLFNVDFGTNNLPHETGVLEDRVSFVKGCYPGQEIVARTHNLGNPRQVLRRLRLKRDLLPVAGAQIFERTAQGMGELAGTVTSSTLSPMRGAAPIAFGMIRWAHAAPGATVLVSADGEQVEAVLEGVNTEQ